MLCFAWIILNLFLAFVIRLDFGIVALLQIPFAMIYMSID